MSASVRRVLIALVSTFVQVHSFFCRSQDVTQIKPQNLNIVTFVPLRDDSFDPAFDQGYSIIPAVELAVEQINRRTDILPYHYFQLNVKDSGCDKAPQTAIETVRILRDLRVTRHGPVAIIGPACSEDSVFVARTFQRTFNLPVFYSGTTPYLSEHADATPNAFGVISSTAVLTDTLIRIAVEENWNWKNIAVLYEDSRELFQHTYGTFLRQLNSSQQVGYTRQISASHIPLVEIIERNIRIVVAFCGKEAARQLACLTGQSEVDFTFPIRQLVFTEKSVEDFLGDAELSFTQQSEGKVYYCDMDTMMRGLNGSVFLNQAIDSVDPGVVTVSNYTVGEIKQQYKEQLSECGKILNQIMSETAHAYPYYDAVWALALGMHIGFNSPVPSFDAVHDAILNNVSLQGVSGRIKFDDDHHISNSVNIQQISGSVAIIRGARNESRLVYATGVFVSDEFGTMNVVLHPVLVALGFVFSSLAFLFTVSLQVMNVYFRQYPSVKASSPRLNHFIFIGCYFLALAIFATTVRHNIPELSGVVLCNVDIVCALFGYCLIFATIFAKSWRTYRIFNHPFKSQQFLRDSSLSGLIALITIVEVVLLIAELIVSPFNKHTSFDTDVSQWPPVKKLTITCIAGSVGYIGLPLMFQFLLTIATVFLASLNRNVKHTNFRTTKQIIMLVYTLAIIWLLGGPILAVFHLLNYSMNVTYSIYASLLTLTVVLCQAVLIVPVLASANGK